MEVIYLKLYTIAPRNPLDQPKRGPVMSQLSTLSLPFPQYSVLGRVSIVCSF